MTRLRVHPLNVAVNGFATAQPLGRVALCPAVAYEGRWWWKKRHEGFAVQVVETQFENCGAFVDSYKVWRTRAFQTTRAAAEEFARELQNTEVPA